MAATLNQAARLSTARNPQPRTEDRLPIRADAEHRRERNRASAAGPALHPSSRPSRARRTDGAVSAPIVARRPPRA